MAAVCPGQNTSFWKPDDIYDVPCVACEKPVEFFKTDIRRKCPHCGQVFVNPRMDFGCAEWCARAAECLGPLIYGEFMEKKQLEKQSREHFERLLSLVPPEEAEVAALFERLYQGNPDRSRLIDFDELSKIREKRPDLVERATAYYQAFMQSRL